MPSSCGCRVLFTLLGVHHIHLSRGQQLLICASRAKGPPLLCVCLVISHGRCALKSDSARCVDIQSPCAAIDSEPSAQSMTFLWCGQHVGPSRVVWEMRSEGLTCEPSQLAAGSEHIINGRTVRINLAGPRPDQQQQQLLEQAGSLQPGLMPPWQPPPPAYSAALPFGGAPRWHFSRRCGLSPSLQGSVLCDWIAHKL